MNNIVDMHCHILPEIDDGAKNEGEPIRCFVWHMMKESV